MEASLILLGFFDIIKTSYHNNKQKLEYTYFLEVKFLLISH